MAETISFTLAYTGATADNNQIDFYDVAHALEGFQRSLALTTHLVLTGEVITQAPALKGAQIVVSPPEVGSWKITAGIIVSVATGFYELTTAPPETVLGNLVRSGYDFVISETLGFHVDFKKTLGQQYDELHFHDHSIKKLSEAKFDAVVEKSETAIKLMHRPIAESKTATKAEILTQSKGRLFQIGPTLNSETYDYIDFTKRIEEPLEIIGRISSYNMNTFKGRIFSIAEGRPIPFELATSARDSRTIRLITESLARNAQGDEDGGDIRCTVFSNYSRSDRLKSLIILSVVRNT